MEIDADNLSIYVSWASGLRWLELAVSRTDSIMRTVSGAWTRTFAITGM